MNTFAGHDLEPPFPIHYLHIVLTAADTYEARSKVVAIYVNILAFALSFPERRDSALRIWTNELKGLALTPSGNFDDVWQELMERRDELYDYVKNSQIDRGHYEILMGVPVESHAHLLLRMLQSGYDGQYADFVTRLMGEQPLYPDLPSDIDSFARRRSHPEDFPTLGDMMLIPAPATGHSRTAVTVLNFLVHHIAFVCDLFKKTNYAPSPEEAGALADYRMNSLSRMFADPGSHMPLDARKHCASINHRTIQDFVVLRAKELLQHTEKELLNWYMYKWLVRCVESVILDIPRTTILFHNVGLEEVVGADVVEQRNYVPYLTASLTIPESIIQTWQEYEPAGFEDVKFKATGPRLLAKNVAKPVQPGAEATCSVDLELFTIRDSSTVAWKVECGHVFHAGCLERMINDIQKNSNCCPLCRAEICVARERRRVE